VLLRSAHVLRRPLPHLLRTPDVFVVGCEILRRLPGDLLPASFVGSWWDVCGDVLREGALDAENVAQLRLVSPGKRVCLVAGLNKRTLTATCSSVRWRFPSTT
jgi:hypothetical protein